MNAQNISANTGPLPPLPEWTKRDDLGGLVPSEIRAAFDAHAREAWTMGLDYGMAHAPAADETTLPDVVRLLGAASKDGKAVKLSAIAAGTLYNAMTTGPAPAAPTEPGAGEGLEILDQLIDSVKKHGNYSQEATLILLGQLRHCLAAPPGPALSHAAIMERAREIGAQVTDEEFQGLKADALALAADGANMSMDVGCMFVLAMIERIEAGAADVARLDFVLDNSAFICTIDQGMCQLMTQDEDEEYHVMSGEGEAFKTKRAAIDAAMLAAAPTAGSAT